MKLQLCKTVHVLPKGKDWIYELKYDGYRILAVNGRLISRNGKDWTDKFKIQVPSNMVLDGEVIAESFTLLRKSTERITYVAFDILELDGEDLRGKPLIERKEILKKQNVQQSDFTENLSEADFDNLCAKGFEGIIAKKKSSIYSGTRNGDWVKLKCRSHAVASQITSPDKLLFENITKAQVADYYRAVASRMLPHLRKRNLSLVKCPKSIENCFYNKNINDERITISTVDELIHHVQMNTIEFHVEDPGLMVFDLDPDEGMSLEKVRHGARDLRSVLDELGLKSFLKTSGGKGYHIVVPSGYGAEFAKNVALVMEAKWPERYTTNIRKDARKGKIFVDWLRNTRGATSVAPYSLRAKKGAPVSMPIEWSELDKIAPSDIDIKNAIARLSRPDPWRDMVIPFVGRGGSAVR